MDAEALCSCNGIGRTDGIRLCEDHHRYWLNDRELISVSTIIKHLLPTSYDGIKPEVLENARVRGVAVDKFFTRALLTGQVDIQPGERVDVKERLSRLLDWWDRCDFTPLDVQRIVYSEKDGVAGTMDLKVATRHGVVYILDLKCVSELQTLNYSMQLGAYASFDECDNVGIIHVMRSRVELVPFSKQLALEDWRTGLAWFRRRSRKR
jgi:hypothetical protein